MSATQSNPQIVPALTDAKEDWAGPRWIGDWRQRLGMNGDAAGTEGIRRRTFAYGFAGAAVLTACICTANVLSDLHDPNTEFFAPLVAEASSWITSMAFFWVIWLGYRMAPPFVRPRWKLLIHVPGAILFALGHVSGFIILRKAAYSLAGSHYMFGSFWPNFAYELRKDAFGYALFVAGFSFIEHLLRQQPIIARPEQPLTIDVRDGARLTRVRLEEVLAVASAGNYVEFILCDGRKLMMRSPLSAVEVKLAPCGFVRTHRSWVVNASQVTGLRPEGSGDYAIEVDTLTVPLSRRFPEALARLKAPKDTQR
jgi:hypothetical protein